METNYPSASLVCIWKDKVFEGEHLIELLEEPVQIGAGTYCQGVRVSVGEPGMYNVERLKPLTQAARAFLAPPSAQS